MTICVVATYHIYECTSDIPIVAYLWDVVSWEAWLGMYWDLYSYIYITTILVVYNSLTSCHRTLPISCDEKKNYDWLSAKKLNKNRKARETLQETATFTQVLGERQGWDTCKIFRPVPALKQFWSDRQHFRSLFFCHHSMSLSLHNWLKCGMLNMLSLHNYHSISHWM